MAIIGAISTIMAVVGVSLIDLLPKGSGCLFRLFVFVVLFILIAILAAVVTYRRSRSGVHLAINGMDIDIVVGDLFATDGVKVIPFDEYFDIQVDDKVISRNSLNGIFIKRYADWNTLKRTVEKSGPSLLEPCKAGDGRIRYPLGTIKDYNEYALLAFTHMNKLNRLRLRRGEPECLLNMGDHLDRIYARQTCRSSAAGVGDNQVRRREALGGRPSSLHALYPEGFEATFQRRRRGRLDGEDRCTNEAIRSQRIY